MKDNYAGVIDALKARAPTHPKTCDCGVCFAIALLTRYRKGLVRIADSTGHIFITDSDKREWITVPEYARKTIGENDD